MDRSPPEAACRFCDILAGKVGAHFVLDEPHTAAFLDLAPLFPGHVLVVPRAHVETLTDLPRPEVGPYFEAVQRVAAALGPALGAQGTFVGQNNRISQSVPHLHTHVVPRRRKDGLRGFFWPRQRYADEREMEEVAAAIRAEL